MIITAICAPFSTLYVCGGFALVVIPLVIGACLGVYLITDVSPGEVGTADIASASAATALVVVYFLVAFYMIYWRNIESYFASLPWLTTATANQEVVGNRVYQKKCPFTGQLLNRYLVKLTRRQNPPPWRSSSNPLSPSPALQVSAQGTAALDASVESTKRPSTSQINSF
jgi:hypothetical protein